MRLLFYTKRLAQVSGLLAAGGFGYAYKTDEGTQRGVKFLWHAIPILAHYRYTELFNNETAEYERLHVLYADRTMNIVLMLGGFYVKLAQTACMMPVCPEVYSRKFSVLQDNAPYKGIEVVRTIIEREFGQDFDSVFDSFEEEPLGAASIGQVHSAVLKNGKEVVVKIQAPEAERNFNIDMAMLLLTVRIFAPGFHKLLRNLRKNFVNEFNYTNEARLQQWAVNAVKDYDRADEVAIPRAYLPGHPDMPWEFKDRGLCTKNVMIMDKLEGKTVTRFGASHLKRMALEHGYPDEYALKKHLFTMNEEDIAKKFGKPPSRLVLKNYLRFAKARNYLWNNVVARPLNWLYNLIYGVSLQRIEYYEDKLPFPNIYDVMDLIFGISAHLVLKHGLANGDPHAGNVMLLDDGRVGFVDWGQLRYLNEEKRLQLCKLIYSVSKRDEVMTARWSHEAGFATESNNAWIANKFANAYFNSWDDYATKELGGMAKWEENIARVDPLVSMFDSDVFIGVRNIFLSRLTCRQLGLMNIKSSKHLSPYAEKLLREHPGGDDLIAQVVPGRSLPDYVKPKLEGVIWH